MTNHQTPAVKGMLEELQTPALRELADQQVRFAPPARRLEQLARAEQLLAEIDPGRHVSVSVRLLPDHRFPPGRVPRPADPRRGRWCTTCA